MTLRDIAVAFGIEVDQRSVSTAENAIKGVKSMATKLLGAIGIGFSIAGIANLAEAAADVEALESQFSQVFGYWHISKPNERQFYADCSFFKDYRHGRSRSLGYCKPVNESSSRFRSFL